MNPPIGTRVKAREAGKNGTGQFVWTACDICGAERWIAVRRQQSTGRCRGCQRMEGHPLWKGGRRIDPTTGYVELRLSPDDPYYVMASRNRVREHRLVMAQHLGHPLTSTEHVHHKNGIKSDNRVENLEILGPRSHRVRHAEETRELKYLRGRVAELEARVRELEENRETEDHALAI